MTRQTVLLIALLLSLAVNLLVAGVVIGRHSTGGREAPPGVWAAQELPPEARRLVRQRMRDQIESVRPLRSELREAREAIRLAIVSEDYDPQALKDALARLRAIDGRYKALLHGSMADIAAELPRAQRIALLRSAMRRGAPGGRPGAEPPEGPPRDARDR